MSSEVSSTRALTVNWQPNSISFCCSYACNLQDLCMRTQIHLYLQVQCCGSGLDADGTIALVFCAIQLLIESVKIAFIGAGFSASRLKTLALEKQPSFEAFERLYQRSLFEQFCCPKLYPLAGFYSFNQSNRIFEPCGKTTVAVLAAVNGNESTRRVAAQ